ncbi:MFS transporter [Mycolicibacterium fortuitum]|uniref:MFS transporter n=2 Tax=Mycolicibacterium fortuitum TaxID=1766 RepID=UPI0026274A53|nr:MFS transporter [Mycolicibacterium fortuitum]
MSQLFSRSATSGACAAMVAVGGLLAAYGPAIPELKNQFGLSDATAGSGLAVQSVGAVVGVLAAQPVLHRRGNRFAVASSLLLIIIGSGLIAGAPTWSLTLTGAVVAGLGLGGCDALITQLLLIGYGERGPALVNVAHACFGIGTVVAPAVLAGIGPENYRLVFAGVAMLGFAAAATMRGLAPRPTPADAAESTPATAASAAPRLVVVGVVGGLLVLYIAHFAVQSGIGSWEPTRLHELGHSSTIAGLATSGYWLAMVVGRFAVAPIAQRVAPSAVVIVSAVGMAAAVTLAFHAPATIWAYLLAGLFIGPIFPNGLNWLITTGYAQGSTFAYVIAGAMAGAVICPPLLGALIGSHGTDALAPTLLVGSLITVAAAVIVWIAARRTPDRSSTNSFDPSERSYSTLREADL